MTLLIYDAVHKTSRDTQSVTNTDKQVGLTKFRMYLWLDSILDQILPLQNFQNRSGTHPMGLKAPDFTLTIHHRLVTTLNKYEWSYTSPSPYTPSQIHPCLQTTRRRYLSSAHTQCYFASPIYAVCSLSNR